MSKLSKLRSLVPMHEIEQAAQQQIYDNLADERLLRMAIMPDVHAGYDLPVGAVALVDAHVCPGYVGYDIGCGMCAVNTGVAVVDILPGKRERIALFECLNQVIPKGVGGSHRKEAEFAVFQSALGDALLDKQVNKGVRTQLGTLGSGNHFLEVSADSDGYCWVTIHSGSRNPGHTVGTVYMARAKRQRDKFLAIDSDLGRAYMNDMEYCQSFALENRRRMLSQTLTTLGFDAQEITRLLAREMINENHNHAELLADGTVLHRKGATPAAEGQLGIIPANMRDGIYVTRGLGNAEFLCSASHGAGRVMSRSQGKKRVKLEAFQKAMQGVVARVDQGTLDESPFVYKDINAVIAAQDGVVVEVIGHLKPLINLKG